MDFLTKGGFGLIYKDKINENKIYKILIDEKSLSSSEINILFNLNSPYLLKGIFFNKHTTASCTISSCICIEKLESLNELNNYVTTKHILFDLAFGLKCLHENNYLHLDISISNCMHKDGIGKLIDFGMACKIHEDEIIFPEQSKITPLYRPYENLIGSTKWSKKSDIWSLGMVFLELITGFNFKKMIQNEKGKSESVVLKFVEEITKDITRFVYKSTYIPFNEQLLCVDLIKNMLSIENRYDINRVLDHMYFFDIVKPLFKEEIISKFYITNSNKNLISDLKILIETVITYFSGQSYKLLFASLDLLIRFDIDLYENREKYILCIIFICYKMYVTYDDFSSDEVFEKLYNSCYECENDIIINVGNVIYRDYYFDKFDPFSLHKEFFLNIETFDINKYMLYTSKPEIPNFIPSLLPLKEKKQENINIEEFMKNFF